MQLYRLILCLLYLQIIFSINAVSYDELFQGYLKNDLDAQKLQLELDAARSNLQLFYYKDLVEFKLGIPNGKFTFSKDEVSLDFTPELSLKFPEWRNTSFSFQFPTAIPIAAADDLYVPDVHISAQTDIFPFKKKITAKDVERVSLKRTILEKERSVAQQISVVRTSFLSLLKEVFQAKHDVDEANVDHNDAIRDLRLAQLQGYGEDSLEFKRLNLAVSKKLRLINEKTREYQQKLQRLAAECAMEIDELPVDIPEAELPDIQSLTLRRYKEYESAVYAKYKNDLDRKVSKNEKNFYLAGTVGYEAKTGNDKTDNNKYTTSSKSHYIEPGLSASYNGFSAGVGVNIPITQNSPPELTFSMEWSPFTIAQTRLENKIMTLKEKGDSLDIAQTVKNFNTKFDELLLKKETLEWQRDTYEAEEELYMQQAQEYEKRYNAGYISESEYERGIIEYQSAVTQNLLGKIERLIFVSETAALFLPEADIIEGE